MTTATYSSPGIHCAACAMVLEGLEDDLPGVASVDVSIKSQEVTIVYDEAELAEAALMTQAEELGYQLFPKA